MMVKEEKGLATVEALFRKAGRAVGAAVAAGKTVGAVFRSSSRKGTSPSELAEEQLTAGEIEAEPEPGTEPAETTVAGARGPQVAPSDELTAISGVGPAIERRLNDAGITTFAELARTPHERLGEILKGVPGVSSKVETWTAESKDLAGLP